MDSPTTPSNVTVELPGWRVEPLARAGRWIMVVYKDGEARGSIEVFTEIEKGEWIHAIASLNSKPESGK